MYFHLTTSLSCIRFRGMDFIWSCCCCYLGRIGSCYWLLAWHSFSNDFFNIFGGKIIRSEFPKGSSLIEFMRKKFGKSLFKLILLMTIFYMFIFLCAEVTAVAVLINYYIRHRSLDYRFNSTFSNTLNLYTCTVV